MASPYRAATGRSEALSPSRQMIRARGTPRDSAASTNGASIASLNISLPDGTEEIVLAAILLAILLFRPNGLTGGRELELPRRVRTIHEYQGAALASRCDDLLHRPDQARRRRDVVDDYQPRTLADRLK